MLRTCNVLRIASVPVLRKDGARRRDAGRRTYGAGRNPRPTPRNYQLSIVTTPVSDI
ncbi:MAG: hypothetical protein LBM98_08210 [Oscillospiraceae bacterium]|nr:hypothetical protein [Oscillospiraceae bacterium]